MHNEPFDGSDLLNHAVINGGVLPQEVLYFNKGGTESCSGFVEFGDSYGFFDSINRKAMLNKKSDKIAQEAAQNGAGDIFYDLSHDRLFIFTLGGIAALMTLFLIHTFINLRCDRE
jgi:hypothetical protein